jgi:uncharacterized protein YdaU (DUF1376 family)
MAKQSDFWIPIYIGDYLADTLRLTTEQHGAYLLLIFDYWRNGPPPDDNAVLARITGLSQASWAHCRPTLERLFQSDGKVWRHKRIDMEMARVVAVRARNSENGAKGGRPKNPNETQTEPKRRPNRTNSHSHIYKIKSIRRPGDVGGSE